MLITLAVMIRPCLNAAVGRKLHTTSEAADLLGVSAASVRRMISRGEIESEKVGRARLMTGEAIEAAARRRAEQGRAPGGKEAKEEAELALAKKRARKKDATRLLKTLS